MSYAAGNTCNLDKANILQCERDTAGIILKNTCERHVLSCLSPDRKFFIKFHLSMQSECGKEQDLTIYISRNVWMSFNSLIIC